MAPGVKRYLACECGSVRGGIVDVVLASRAAFLGFRFFLLFFFISFFDLFETLERILFVSFFF